jgi:hypothetical protein
LLECVDAIVFDSSNFVDSRGGASDLGEHFEVAEGHCYYFIDAMDRIMIGLSSLFLLLVLLFLALLLGLLFLQVELLQTHLDG